MKVRQTLLGFREGKADGFTPTALLISGPALADESIVAKLTQRMDMPVQMIDLRALTPKIEISAALAQYQPCMWDGALAIGFLEFEGRSCIHFHRSSSPFRSYWNNYNPYLRVPAILLAIVLLLGMGSIVLDCYLLQQRVNKLNTQIETIFSTTFPGARRVGDALDQMKSEMKKAQGGSIDPGQTVPDVRTIDILYQLSQLIPKEIDVVFSRMVLGNDGLTLSGETGAFNFVDEIKGRLERSKFFKQVVIASANTEKSGKIHFKLKIEL